MRELGLTWEWKARKRVSRLVSCLVGASDVLYCPLGENQMLCALNDEKMLERA